MNVYDFDGTIYDGDSTIDFWMSCVKKYPKVLYALPAALLFGVLNQLGMCEKSSFKEKFYGFLRYVPDIKSEVQAFWDIHIENIKDFYRKRQRADDLVISASPDFLIDEICTRLGIACIASKVDPFTGKLREPNCHGKEKVRMFHANYPQAMMEEFYSDSLSDIFLAREADRAFLVKKNVIQKWNV